MPAIKKSDRQLTTMLNSIADGVFTINPQQNFFHKAV